jgi:4-amino-4-deoxy-L-arabinose transferase-like glycosyltransferase
MPRDAVSRRVGWTLAAIGLLAAALRVYAIGWGLPDVHHPDEPYILNRALAFAKGDLSPHNFLYPTLYFYALFAWEGAFFVLGRIVGLYQSVGEFEREFFVDPSRVMMAGRLLTVTFGIATVAAVYQFGRRLFDRPTGLGAALLLAVAPFAVRDAHYIKHDVPVTLFVVLTQVFLARLVVEPAAAEQRRSWVLAGAMAGLALSTQYYAFPIVLAIVAAAGIHARRTRQLSGALALLVWAGAACVVAFLLTTPFIVLEPAIAARDIAAVRQIDVDRAVSSGGAFGSLGAYMRMIAVDAIGWPAAIAALAGFAIPCVRCPARGILLLCFPLAFLAFLANTVPMSRYVNPLLPSLAVAAAFALTRLARAVRANPSPAFSASLILIAAVPGFLGSVRADRFYAQADTRTEAREFLERTAPSGATILVQPHSVQLHASRDALVEALRAHLGTESAASVKFQKELDAAASTSPSYRVLYLGRVTDGGFDPDKIYVSPEAFDADSGLAPLRAQRVAYVALNQYNGGHQAFAALNAALQREAHLLATFSPYRKGVGPDRRAATAPFFHNTADRIDPALERPGPVIQIWRID